MRQVHQLAQVLARVLVRRQTEDVTQAREAIREAWRMDPGLDGAHPVSLSREELLESCSSGGRFHPEKALVVVDLLTQESEIETELGDAGRAADLAVRALWLLEAARAAPEAALPLDLYERLSRLEFLAGPDPTDDHDSPPHH